MSGMRAVDSMRPIEIPSLWNKFKGKFGWRIQQPERIYLNRVVQPVTLIDDLLIESEITQEVVSITGSGMVSLMTVPDGYRYTLYAIGCVLSTGNWKIDDIYFDDGVATVKFDENSGGVTEWYSGVISPVVLDAGFGISVNIIGYMNPGNLFIKYLYTKELLE